MAIKPADKFDAEILQEFCDNQRKKWTKLEVRIMPGLSADEVVRLAEREKADMVVMGARGHSEPTETTTPIRPARGTNFGEQRGTPRLPRRPTLGLVLLGSDRPDHAKHLSRSVKRPNRRGLEAISGGVGSEIQRS